MKHLIPMLFSGLVVFLPAAAVAKSITSPSELGPSDYWAYTEATNGAFARTEDRGTTPVSVNLPDPVIGGVGVSGNLTASNDRTIAGPGTNVNAQLTYSGAPAFDTDIDLRSLVTFDLAAFGAPGAAASVRVIGSGIGGVTGNFFGQFGQASASSFGYVTIYQTDANGAPSSIVRTFEVRGNLTNTPINDIVTLDRNELYKVIVRSTADIHLFNVSSFDLSAYMIVDPVFSSETAGVDVFVSSGAAPVPLPGAAWLFGAGLFAVMARARRGHAARYGGGHGQGRTSTDQ